MCDWKQSVLMIAITLVSVLSHSYATSVHTNLSTEAPEGTGYKRTTELSVIGMTKTYLGDESESETELATGDLIRASTPIWASVPVQISASYARQIEHDTRIGVSEQHTVMSQGLTYAGANQENSLQTVPHLNTSRVAASLYQTSRSIQPSVALDSLGRSIKPTPSYAPYLFTIAASPTIYTETGVDSFTLTPLITTTTTSIGSPLEALPTASPLLPRHFQTAQNWRISSSHSDASLLPMPTVVPTLWIDKEVNTVASVMATATIQPSPSNIGFIDGGEISTSSLLSKLSRTTQPPPAAPATKSAPASGIVDPPTMPPPTHAQLSSHHQTTITPSFKTLPSPEWFKELSTPADVLLHGSTEYYDSDSHTTINDMAPTEPGQIGNNNNDTDDDDQSLRPAMTPSPSIIMESSTSYWNWSHRIPVNASNTTMNKDGEYFSVVTGLLCMK